VALDRNARRWHARLAELLLYCQRQGAAPAALAGGGAARGRPEGPAQEGALERWMRAQSDAARQGRLPATRARLLRSLGVRLREPAGGEAAGEDADATAAWLARLEARAPATPLRCLPTRANAHGRCCAPACACQRDSVRVLLTRPSCRDSARAGGEGAPGGERRALAAQVLRHSA
jgi:hypothetical protein